MQHRIVKYILVSLVLLLSTLPALAQRGAGRGAQKQGNQGMCLGLLNAAPPSQALRAQEEAQLAYVREEEKLARDIYTTLQEKWGVRVFGNIARGEGQHFNAVKLLLDRYRVQDPVAIDEAGRFQDPSLQTLYGDLISQGGTSLQAALRVGAAIEDLSIHHLEKAIGETENSELKLIYGNLKQASENHMRAFVRQLQAAGENYAPQYIGQEAFSRIVGNQQQTGRGMGMGYGARGNGRRGAGPGNNGNCPRIQP